MRSRLLFSCLLLIGILGLHTTAQAQDGSLSGTVVDADDRPIQGITVIVCDDETGIPVSQATFRPFTEEMKYQEIAFATTNPLGQFTLANVRPGTYRLLAQSWQDATEEVEGVLEVNGRIVHLRGIAPGVVVPSPEAEQVKIRPAGNAMLNIATDPLAPNDETLLVVSRASLAADPILAFGAWTGPFIPQMLAGNRMPHGRTTIYGLPAGVVHLGAFAADNNPGFGGAQCELMAGRTSFVKIPLIASWSDGHKQPPPRLEPLVKRLSEPDAPSAMELIRKSRPEIAQSVEEARSQPRTLGAGIGPFLDESIRFLDDGRVPLKDLLAADAYVRLLRYDRQRRARAKQPPAKKLDVDSSVTYAQALRDLHARLGREYPCFELKGIDWQAVGARLLPQAETVTSDEEFGLLCLQMVAALEDSHAQLLPAAAQVPTVAFPSWDAGFACLVDDREEPVVYYVAADSPAATAGLQVGSTVLMVNGVDADTAVRKTMQQLSKYVGYSSERYLRYHAFRFFARQMKQDQAIELVVESPDGKNETVEMRAEQRAGYLPRLPIPIDGIADSGNVSWKMLDGRIGYIYVRRIRPELIELLDRAVGDLREARGLIIDVRGNSGGGFDASRAHRNFDLNDGGEPSRPRFTGKIAVLIDARCISAGEGWTSWFIARQRARLFGETTAGASSRKTTYKLPNGLYSVRYPVKAYRGSLDRPIERRGLEPDVPVMPSAHDIAQGRDTVLEAARHWLENAQQQGP